MKLLVAVLLAATTLNTGVFQRVDYFRSVELPNGEVVPIDFACKSIVQPYAKDTPNPVMNLNTYAAVDIIVGWDGKVYNPIVVESEGVDKEMLAKLVGKWHYDPATCDGRHVTTEGFVIFLNGETEAWRP